MLSFGSFGQIRIASDKQVRQEGRFISSSYNYTKKNIYNIVKELRKTIKKSMATGIAQKNCTTLFPLWSLRKNGILKNKKYIKEETQKALKGEKK